LLMLASNNILSPATGRPIITPSQDMVLGCYYLTADNPNRQKGAGRYFTNMDDTILAYEQSEIDLHSSIWVRYDGAVDDEDGDAVPEVETSPDGIVVETYPSRRVRKDAEGVLISQYVRTTAGRIIYNKTVQDSLAS
jgi:DNA-directed RNA polymerase subunit beta'